MYKKLFAPKVIDNVDDKSTFAIAQLAFKLNSPANTNLKKKPKGGWPDAVSAVALSVYKDCTADSVYPFVVGDVATNSGHGYSLMLAVRTAITAWNNVTCSTTLLAALDAVKLACIAAPSIVNSVDTTAPMNVAIGKLEMMHAALNEAQIIIDAFQSLADGTAMPAGCLQSDVLINTDEMAGQLFVHHLSVLNDKFQSNDFSERDVQDAHGWYIEIGKCKLAFSDRELAIIASVKAQIEAAQSQSIDSEASVTASAMLAEWRNM